MERDIKFSAILAALGMGAVGGISNAADMCHPDESAVVCAIIEQRNNMADELAVAEGGRRIEVAKRKAEAQFWKEYVAGLPDGAALTAHMTSVCDWKGPQSQPAAKMCQWWDGNYVPHPVPDRSPSVGARGK